MILCKSKQYAASALLGLMEIFLSFMSVSLCVEKEERWANEAGRGERRNRSLLRAPWPFSVLTRAPSKWDHLLHILNC